MNRGAAPDQVALLGTERTKPRGRAPHREGRRFHLDQPGHGAPPVRHHRAMADKTGVDEVLAAGPVRPLGGAGRGREGSAGAR